jgi:hypothetical protein
MHFIIECNVQHRFRASFIGRFLSASFSIDPVPCIVALILVPSLFNSLHHRMHRFRASLALLECIVFDSVSAMTAI